MTVTELIEKLKDFKSGHGDLNIYVFEEGYGYSEPYLATILGDLDHCLDEIYPEIDIFREDKEALLLTHERWINDRN